MLYLFASRSAPMRSSSIARLSQKTSPAGKPAFVILARDDVVGAGRGEQGEPGVEFRRVDQRAVCREQIVEREAVAR